MTNSARFLRQLAPCSHAPSGIRRPIRPCVTELREVSEIAQSTLENVRMLSQALHPVMLEESGLESTVSWYIPTVEKQTGLVISYEKSGQPFAVDGSAGIHIYRILQEALNNVARHSEAREAWVRLKFQPDSLTLEVEDHGKGFNSQSVSRGIGMVAMRERAELLRRSHRIHHAANGRYARPADCSSRKGGNECLKKSP
jgi:two-component system sensor histidine kinase DegS